MIKEASSWESVPKSSGLWEEAAQVGLISHQGNEDGSLQWAQGIVGLSSES